ncbi:dual specificity protein phosphatase 18 isoform X2 [Micropterus dolomieu]|uniref:dual specificity protein phosphatase 18 isoform X2 n=1 Tax=Micropterus dolomieu TaxID=147949 RepID=UPI001E8D38F9|nr:dual specificity protein phosphatase 18 isoform X2 [Micropterus dolomieu]
MVLAPPPLDCARYSCSCRFSSAMTEEANWLAASCASSSLLPNRRTSAAPRRTEEEAADIRVIVSEVGLMAVSQITPTLFLSGAEGPLNAALVSQKGITLIVNATVSHASPAYPGVECVRVPVSDLPSARLGDHFDRVAERIHGNRAGGTLVHCAAGMSRSPALVMAYLMRYRGVTLRQAHRWVQDSRPYVRLNAGFWEQLLQYERRLYGKNTVRVAAVEETPRVTRTAPPPQQTNWLTLVPRSPLVTRASLMSRPQVMTPATKRRRGTKSSGVKV